MKNTRHGFTFIEVLVAMLIFTLAALAAVSVGQGAVRATREAKEISTATWLLQSTMVELETHLETEGIDKGCDKKKEGKFAAPYDSYTFTTECYQIDFKISETASKVMAAMSGGDDKDKDKDDSQNNVQDQATKMIMDTASKYISDSMREIHVTVEWAQGKTKRHVDLTTHFARYDQQVALPIGNLGGT